ncbi:hypothetical protein [Streptomyces sp. OE57]|uniref:hypothetical protein n=1 Tax=Streptomyces lacaronensis TaxID=3379885 RepID=UPI0039B76B16
MVGATVPLTVVRPSRNDPTMRFTLNQGPPEKNWMADQMPQVWLRALVPWSDTRALQITKA